MQMRKMLVLAIAQAGVGVPGAPIPGSHAIQVATAMPKIMKAEYIKRQLIRGSKGNYGTFTVGEHNEIEFECELAHTGAAGTATPLAPLLKGCSFSETLSAGVDAVYTLHSNALTYLTIYCYLDGVLFQLQDAWGTVAYEGNPKTLGKLKFKFIGKYVAMTDVIFPAGAVFTSFLKPKPIGKTNTPTFTVHGIAVKASAFSWDLANDIKWRDLLNESGPINPDRSPSARTTFELTTVAVKNWGETVRLNTEAAIQQIHGAGGGNIIQMDIPKFVFTADPDITDVDGQAMLSGQGEMCPDAGDDELVLTFK